MRTSLNYLKKLEERNRRDWHKRLIKELGREKAIRTIKKAIPSQYNLKSYLDELEAEIAAEKK